MPIWALCGLLSSLSLLIRGRRTQRGPRPEQIQAHTGQTGTVANTECGQMLLDVGGKW